MSNPVVFVHGFRYDPRAWGPDHPGYETYPTWQMMLPDRRTVPFVWFSKPSLMEAWKHGRWNTYRYAWDLADRVSRRLVDTLMSMQGPVDIVCHSLGSRVTMQAVKHCPHVRRVLILNGAEYSHAGRKTAEAAKGATFYNVVVPADDVLDKLARFAPGFRDQFLGSHGINWVGQNAPTPPTNWRDLYLDWADGRPAHWAAAKGLVAPAGDNPSQIGDHWYTFKNEDNWPLYRAILGGEWDDYWLNHPAG